MSQTRVSDLLDKGLSQSKFLELYPNPALLFSTVESEDDDLTVETDIKNITDTDLLSCMGESAAPTIKFISSRVFFLEKTPRNAFPDIVLGRDPASDIIVSIPSVSKKHAFFKKINELWYVFDNKSTNGTSVDNSALNFNSKALLRDNSRLVFGFEAMARYFTPMGLWGVLCLYSGLNFMHASVFEE